MNALPLPHEAAAEALRRRRARRSLADYAQAIPIPGKPATEDPDEWLFEPIESSAALHHLLLLRCIERAQATRYGRFMVFMPPGAAKSTYTSVVAPTYFMGKNPGTKIILASYGSDLARRHGRKARQIVRSTAFSAIWSGKAGGNVTNSGEDLHVTLSKESSAANEWALTNGSEYFAAGLLAGLTGNRCHGGLIDDPIKGREQADSPTIREKTWEAYVDDFQTRLIPGGWVGLVQTRWHENDLAGRLLPDGYQGESGLIRCKDGRDWEIINLPAECERADDPLKRQIGDMLWPQWFDPVRYWAPFRLIPRTWAALFQQRPRPDEGLIFKESWCRDRWGAIPQQCRTVVHSWDTAQKPAQVNDPSVGACFRFGDGVPGYYLADVHRERIDYPTLKSRVINMAERDRPTAILIEDKSSGQSLIQELRTTTSLPIVAIEPMEAKVFRAMDVSPMVESGLFHLPKVAPWLIDFESEFFGFPLSTHDDQVDAVTQFLKWVRGWSATLESVGAGNRRTMADAALPQDVDQGMSTGGSESTEGFV